VVPEYAVMLKKSEFIAGLKTSMSAVELRSTYQLFPILVSIT
jgi:hypothetical protein